MKIVRIVLGIVIAAAVLGLSIDTVRTAPRHARVWVDEPGGIYFAPVCLESGSVASSESTLREMAMGDADRLKYRPDRACVNAGAFTQGRRSLTGLALERVGILAPLPDRWSPDGVWRW